MTNYNPKQNIEEQITQVEVPKTELESIASAQSNTRKGLRPRTYGIIAGVALALGTIGGACYVLNEMRGLNAVPFGRTNPAESAGKVLDNIFDSVFKYNNDKL